MLVYFCFYSFNILNECDGMIFKKYETIILFFRNIKSCFSLFTVKKKSFFIKFLKIMLWFIKFTF